MTESYPLSSTANESADFSIARSTGTPFASTTNILAQSTSEPSFSPKVSWSNAKKARTTALFCVAVLASTYSSSAYTSSIPALQKEFGMSQRMAYAGVAFYVLGYALGPLTWAPLSSMFGKRPVYVVAYTGFTAFMWGIAYAPDTGAVMVFRFLSGFCSSATLSNVASSIGDYTTIEERGLHSTVYAISAFGGPALGPLFGGLIVFNADSQWNFNVMAIFASVSLVLLSLVEETYLPVLARKRQHVKMEASAELKATGSRLLTAFREPFYMLATEPILLSISLYLSLLYALIYAFFAVFPIVYQDKRAWSVTDLSKTYVALMGGFLLGGGCIGVLRGLGARKCKRLGVQPDLYDIFKPLYLTAWMIPTALFIIAFASDPDTHVAGDIIAEVLFGLGVICAFMCLLTFLVNIYGTRSAAAIGGATFMRSITAAAFPLFITDCVDALGINGTCGMFGGIGVLALPLPFVIEKIGKAHRNRTESVQTETKA